LGGGEWERLALLCSIRSDFRPQTLDFQAAACENQRTGSNYPFISGETPFISGEHLFISGEHLFISGDYPFIGNIYPFISGDYMFMGKFT
jgi:hypothetical protein